MVVVNVALVRREMKKRQWSRADLASKMGCDQRTVENILNGRPLAHSTQVALFKAFSGLVPFRKLLTLSPGEITTGDAGANDMGER